MYATNDTLPPLPWLPDTWAVQSDRLRTTLEGLHTQLLTELLNTFSDADARTDLPPSSSSVDGDFDEVTDTEPLADPYTAHDTMMTTFMEVQSALELLSTSAMSASSITDASAAVAVDTLKCWSARALVCVILGDGCLVKLLERYKLPEADGDDVTDSRATASLCARELMTRTLDVLLWTVDAICAPLVACASSTAAFAASSSQSGLQLWLTLLSCKDTLLDLATLGLRTSATGRCAWGAAVHSGVLRMLDLLLLTSEAVQIAAAAFIKKGEDGTDTITMRALTDGSAALTCALTSEPMLHHVAAQLHLPVQVVDEVQGAPHKTDAVLYDLLRHGVLPTAAEVRVAQEEAEMFDSHGPRRAMRITSPITWTLFDAARTPQSPLELYSCAVAFIDHVARHRLQHPDTALAGIEASGVWPALVAVLQRALQEDETALTTTPAPTSASNGEKTGASAPTAVTAAAVTPATSATTIAAAAPFVPSLQPRRISHAITSNSNGAAKTMSAAATGAAPQVTEGALMDSEPASPFESPVMRLTSAIPQVGGGLSPTQRLPGVIANTSTTIAAAATVTSGRRFPQSPPRGTWAEMDDGATIFSATTTTNAETSAARRAFALRSHSRGVCGELESVRSAEVTLTGMTEADTISTGASRPLAPHSTAALSMASMVVGPRPPGSLRSPAQRASAAVPVHASSPNSPGNSISRGHLARSAAAATAMLSPHSGPGQVQPYARSLLSVGGSQTLLQVALSAESRFVGAASAEALRPLCGSSKSCDRERERLEKSTSALLSLPCVRPDSRMVFPSDVQLTIEVLAVLSCLTDRAVSSTACMSGLVDAGVLSVLSELLDFPGATLQEVTLATVENCFVFWEHLVSTNPAALLCDPVSLTTHVDPRTRCEGKAGCPPHRQELRLDTSALRDATEEVEAELPLPLQLLLRTFAAVLSWSGESWAMPHAQYTQRAVTVLTQVLELEKNAASSPNTSMSSPVTGAPCGGTAAGGNGLPRRQLAGLQEAMVATLLRSGVIAHIWRFLSTDATQIPGLLPTNGTGKGSGARSSRPQSSADGPPGWSYSHFLYGSPAPSAAAVLSPAQCCAMRLLGTLARSLDWAVSTASADVLASTASSMKHLRPSPSRKREPVPRWSTYAAFMEESFKHLPAFANCLRRSTYTRSQSRPITTDELDALSRLLHVLRILFASMAPAISTAASEVMMGSPGAGKAAARRDLAQRQHTWLQQIIDSQVLDVLAHIGTAAELITFPLPRLCVFTLRSLLQQAHLLLCDPTREVVGCRGGGEDLHTPARAQAYAATVQASRAGVAAIRLLLLVPPPPPSGPPATTWGGPARREALLTVLLSRMQRRCAGQSPSAAMLLRLEVLALLSDVLEPLTGVLHTASGVGSEVVMEAEGVVAQLVELTHGVVAAVMECRVWSGTAQDLRYLDLDNLILVKEALRFLRRVAQLVTGSYHALMTLPPPQNSTDNSGTSSSGANRLGKRAALVLLSESTNVAFAFHTVTMDFPLTLAGLINGARWQSVLRQSIPNISNSIASSSTVPSNRPATSSSSNPGPRRSPAPSQVSGSRTPAVEPNKAKETEKDEFSDEDRRESCEIAATALVEVLATLRRVDLLLRTSRQLDGAPRSFTMTHQLPLTLSGTSQTEREPSWSHGASQQEVDVVVMQSAAGEVTGVVTSRLYPAAVAALAEAAGQNASFSPPFSVTHPAVGVDTPTVEVAPTRTVENPRNWRETEQQWRRREVHLRAAHEDSMKALDLDVLDRYLARSRFLCDVVADGSPVGRSSMVGAGTECESDDDTGPSCAAQAMTSLAALKKRYLTTV